MAKHPRLIVFYNFDYELEMLRTLSSCKPIETMIDTGLEKSSSRLSDSEIGLLERKETTSGRSSLNTSNSELSSTSTPDPKTTNPISESSPLGPKLDVRTAVDLGSQPTSSKISQPAECLVPPVIAEWNGHKHQQVPTTERWIYLVQYAAGGEGWNCITTNAMAFYSLPYSYKQFHQAHGRIDRLNTPYVDLYYYTLMSFSLMDLAIKKCLDQKRSFNESGYLRKT
jgi:hypothetical protein